MLNALFRRAARLAHAPVFRLAVPGLMAWSLWAPTAHAAEPPANAQVMPAPFKHYQGWRDEPLQDWRQANERVGEVGGWRTYLRESAPGGGADAGAGDQGSHGGHGHHGH
ncbi:MAG: hypothetical protein Q8R61_08365 [Thiobacillus sp.]|uniref:hypothetical protein n=1 Tax=Thiobacillus sp. TaxID=924 RepID=UPI002735F7BF|nr:hypothetical protein [Thiobacillus sp.]MDP3585124.1 hypothetical protein [Thiobacillus sp.]